MRIAVFADIHANRQAFEACLKHARLHRAEGNVLLGDYVGYGADPDWTTDKIIELTLEGALAVQGNHDDAVENLDADLNIEARIAMEWTRGELGIAQRKFLAELQLVHRSRETLFVHADASSPGEWNYVISRAEAARSLRATTARVTFCGHVHRPAVYTMSALGKVTAFSPIADVPIQLLPARRWLVVAGSVGQPRDGQPAASYLLFDTDRQEVTFYRAPYDVGAAAARIRQMKLPSWLADRLAMGR